jgi:predicted metal-dependent peptidase
LIRDLAAKEIVEANKNRGSVPGDLARWANARLKPAVDWRKELRSVVSRHLGMQAGKTDYSYGRLPRRRIPGVITPGMVQSRPPSVAVVIDTSGSMGTTEIDQAVADLAGLLRAVTGSAVPLRVLACDAAVGEVQHLTSVKNLKLTGGGGTDMGVGIHAAATLRPTPDVIVTLTDGYTGWPTTPDPAAPMALYVAVILNNEDTAAVPDFMHTITDLDGQRQG